MTPVPSLRNASILAWSVDTLQSTGSIANYFEHATELAADLLPGMKAASHLFGDLPEPLASCLGAALHELV